MKRQIKFRVWDGKKFHYFPYTGCVKIWINSYNPMVELDGMDTLSLWNDIQQFSGMIDKNSKDIYEGDIIKNKSYDDWGDKIGFFYNSVVFYSDDIGAFLHSPCPELKSGTRFDYPRQPEMRDIEVIGNIFENPELIQKPELQLDYS